MTVVLKFGTHPSFQHKSKVVELLYWPEKRRLGILYIPIAYMNQRIYNTFFDYSKQ
jgi:hypothetical protein